MANLQTEMRVTTVPVFIFVYVTAWGQELTGKYQDYHGHSLELSRDSTFRFDWRFDLIHTWATGKWSASGRFINFQYISVLDTLQRTDKPDSLVLSLDDISNRIDEQRFMATLLVSGGQRSDEFSDKLFRKGKRLFFVDRNGKLNRKKYRGIWPQKKWPWGYKEWPTWYKKES